MIDILVQLAKQSGFYLVSWKELVMIGVGLLLIYLAIYKKSEPLLLLPIGFGCILTNLPLSGLMSAHPVGLFYFLYKYGVSTEIFPLLIFMGVGAMTDFGPLIANPWTILLGAAAQFGVFLTLIVSLLLGFTLKQSASIAIIGGADGPTSIYTAVKLAPEILGAIAVAAYTYMSLVPIIQPPIMKWVTTKKERSVVMEQLRPVSKLEKILFPIIVTIVISLLFPAVTPLIGMLMLGNLFRESGVVERLAHTAANELINITTILLATTVGGTMRAESFLTLQTLEIIGLGIIAFGGSTLGGVLLGKLYYYLSGGKINPLIGSAGVSAVPMAARVSQKVGQEENPGNFLLMHAMGPNVAGVIGTAVVAGIMISMLAH
jgi:sodium ion-translocating decarboxylase beta subunit